MTKSELIERLADKARHVPSRDVELAIKEMLEQMAQTLQKGERIEIRGFGSFSLHYRAPRVGRNPKTGETVELDGKHVPHFKPGNSSVAVFELDSISLAVNWRLYWFSKYP